MKTCFKCGIEKPISEYYSHPQMGDGHLNKCKECTKKDTEERRRKLESTNLEWVLKERKRHRDKSTRRRADNKDSPYNSKEKTSRYREKFPQKFWAQNMFRKAFLRGDLERQPCEVCGEHKTQAHHDDYSKPLEVRWLCVPHHNEHHVKIREQEVIKTFTK